MFENTRKYLGIEDPQDGGQGNGIPFDAMPSIGRDLGQAGTIQRGDLPGGKFKHGLSMGADWAYERAKLQSSWAKVANNALRFIPNVGLEVASTVGHLFDFDSYGALVGKGEADFSNWLTRAAERGKEKVEEWAPTYTNPGTADFWIKNIFGVAESVGAFYATGFGVGSVLGKGAVVLSKGLTAAQRSARASQIATAIRGANRAGKVASRLAQAEQAAATAAGIQNAAAGAAQAGTSFLLATVSGSMNAHDVYNTIEQDLLSQGIDAVEAQRQAAEAAAVTYNSTVLYNTLLNITSLGPIFRGFKTNAGAVPPSATLMAKSTQSTTGKALAETKKRYAEISKKLRSKKISRAERTGLEAEKKKVGKRLGKLQASADGLSKDMTSTDYLTRLKAIRDNPALEKEASAAWKKWVAPGGVLWEAGQESAEEYSEEIASQRGLIAGGVQDKIDWWSDEAKMAIALGAAGGLMGKGFMAVIAKQNEKAGYDERDFRAALDARIEAVESFQTYQKQLAEAMKSGDRRRMRFLTTQRVSEIMTQAAAGGSTADIRAYAQEQLGLTDEEAAAMGYDIQEESPTNFRVMAQAMVDIADSVEPLYNSVMQNANIPAELKGTYLQSRIAYEVAKAQADAIRTSIDKKVRRKKKGETSPSAEEAGRYDKMRRSMAVALARTAERNMADLSEMAKRADSDVRAAFLSGPESRSIMEEAILRVAEQEGLDQIEDGKVVVDENSDIAKEVKTGKPAKPSGPEGKSDRKSRRAKARKVLKEIQDNPGDYKSDEVPYMDELYDLMATEAEKAWMEEHLYRLNNDTRTKAEKKTKKGAVPGKSYAQKYLEYERKLRKQQSEKEDQLADVQATVLMAQTGYRMPFRNREADQREDYGRYGKPDPDFVRGAPQINAKIGETIVPENYNDDMSGIPVPGMKRAINRFFAESDASRHQALALHKFIADQMQAMRSGKGRNKKAIRRKIDDATQDLLSLMENYEGSKELTLHERMDMLNNKIEEIKKLPEGKHRDRLMNLLTSARRSLMRDTSTMVNAALKDEAMLQQMILEEQELSEVFKNAVADRISAAFDGDQEAIAKFAGMSISKQLEFFENNVDLNGLPWETVYDITDEQRQNIADLSEDLEIAVSAEAFIAMAAYRTSEQYDAMVEERNRIREENKRLREEARAKKKAAEEEAKRKKKAKKAEEDEGDEGDEGEDEKGDKPEGKSGPPKPGDMSAYGKVVSFSDEILPAIMGEMHDGGFDKKLAGEMVIAAMASAQEDPEYKDRPWDGFGSSPTYYNALEKAYMGSPDVIPGTEIPWPAWFVDVVTRVKKKPKKANRKASERTDAWARDGNVVTFTVADRLPTGLYDVDGREIYVPKRDESGKILPKEGLDIPIGAAATIPIGSQVYVSVDENEWWEEQKGSIDENDHWRQIPMVVRDGSGNPIALLESSVGRDNALRQQIYKSWQKGEDVELVVKEKQYRTEGMNIDYAVDENGKVMVEKGERRYNWKPLSAITSDTHKPYVFVAKGLDGHTNVRLQIPEEMSGKIPRRLRDTIENYKPELEDGSASGLVYVAVPNPNGEWTIQLLRTSEVGEDMASSALDYLVSTGDVDTFGDAINVQSNQAWIGTGTNAEQRYLRVYKSKDSKNFFVEFYSKKVGSVVRITSKQLRSMKEGKEVLPEIMKRTSKDEGGTTMYKSVPNKVATIQNKTPVKYEHLLAHLSGKRAQVDMDALARDGKFRNPWAAMSGEQVEHDSYMDYLNEGMDGDPVVSTSLFMQDNTVYHDVSLSLVQPGKESVSEEAVESDEMASAEDIADLDEEIPFRTGAAATMLKRLDQDGAEAWLKERGIPLFWFEGMRQMRAAGVVHGYAQRGVVHLWTAAEIGTEYHEAFHVIFRGWISGDRRQNLYREAAEMFGDPSAADLATLADTYPNIGQDELVKLWLEERMAEGFRDYMMVRNPPRNALERIYQWLRERLLEWLKYGSDLEVLYRSIDENTLSKPALIRGEDTARAYRIRSEGEVMPALTESLSSHLSQRIAAMFEEGVSEKQMRETLRGDMQRMAIAGTDLTAEDYAEAEATMAPWATSVLSRLSENAGDQVVRKEILAEALGRRFKLSSGKTVGLRRNVGVVSGKVKPVAALTWLHGLDTWESVPGEVPGEVAIEGTYERAVQAAADFGISRKHGRYVLTEDDAVEYIYGEGLEADPAEKMSVVARMFFARIPDGEDPVTGMPKMVPAQRAYETIKNAVIDIDSRDGMVEAIRSRAAISKTPWMNEAATALEQLFLSEGYNQQAAAVFTALRLTYTSRHISEGFSSDYPVDSRGTGRFLRRFWQENMDMPGGIFENELPSSERIDKLAEAWEGIMSIASERFLDNADKRWSEAAGHVASFCEDMGMIELSSREVWEEIFSPETEMSFNFFGEQYQGMELFRYLFGKGSSQRIDISGLADAVALGKNPYNEYGSLLSKFSDIAATMQVQPMGAAFVSMGRTMYPINLPTALSETVADMRMGSGERSAVHDTWDADPSFQAMNLYGILKVPAKRAIVSTYDFDHIILKGKKKNLSTATPDELRAVKMQWFGNSPSDRVKLALPTQSDRSKLSAIVLPRLYPKGKAPSDQALAIIRSKLVEADMIEWENALRDWKALAPEQLIEGYHVDDDGNPGRVFGPKGIDTKGTFGSIFLPNLESVDTSGISFLWEEDGDLTYIIGERAATREDVVAELQRRLGDHIQGIVDIKMADSSIPNEVFSGYQTKEAFLSDYVFHDVVYRTEVGKAIAGSRMLYKNYETYTKRFGSSTTTGLKGIKGNGYGLGTLRMAFISDEFTSSDTDEAIAEVIDGAPGLTARQRSDYKRKFSRSNKTDGMGVTSLEKHAATMRELGLWNEETHGKAYANYMAGQPGRRVWGYYDAKGKWKVPSLEPLKTNYCGLVQKQGADGDTRLVHMLIKHSTFPLLDEMIGQNEKLSWMREQLDGGLDVINTDSAAKTGVWGVMNLDDAMNGEGLVTIEVDARWERSPQVIPDEHSQRMNFGSQIRKMIMESMPEKISKGVMFDVGGKKISGRELQDKYRRALAEKVNRSMESFLRRMKVDRYAELDAKAGNMTGVEMMEYRNIRLQMLRVVRGNIIENTGRQTVSENLRQALEIVKIAGYPFYDFRIPSNLPVYERDLQRGLASAFRNQVMRQTINGQGFAQIAEFGKTKGDKELSYVSENGKIVEAEIGLPYNVAYKLLAEKGVDLGRYTAENGEVDLSGIDPELLTVIGYRIPYQELASSVSMRVAKILPKGLAGAVLVPGHITAQQGSDFDIDKLWIIMPNAEYTYVKNGEKLDPKALVTSRMAEFFDSEYGGENDMDEQNVRAMVHALENGRRPEVMSINMDAAGRSDAFHDAFYELYEEWEEMIDGAQIEAKKIAYDLDADMSSMSDRQLENLIFDSMSSVLRHPNYAGQVLSPIDDPEIGNIADPLKQEKLDPLDFDTEHKLLEWNSEGKAGIDVFAANQTALAQAQGNELRYLKPIFFDGKLYRDLARVRTGDGEYTSKVNSKFISSSVDNGKDPRLSVLGVNVHTRPIAVAAIWLGIAEKGKYSTTEFITTLTRHKAIQDAVRRARKDDVSLVSALTKIRGTGKQKLVTWAELSSLSDNRKGVADLALKLLDASGEIRTISKVLNIDRARPRSSHDSEALLNAIDSLGNVSINGVAGAVASNPAIMAYVEAVTMHHRIAGFVLPSARWRSMRLSVCDAIGADPTDGQSLEHITSAALFDMLSRPGSPLRDHFELDNLQRLLRRGNSKETFNVLQRAQALKAAYERRGVYNEFLRRIGPAPEGDRMAAGFIHFNGNVPNPHAKAQITADYKRLAEGSYGNLSAEERIESMALARDLAIYQLITTGFTPMPGTMMPYFPPSLWEDTLMLTETVGKMGGPGDPSIIAQIIAENMLHIDGLVQESYRGTVQPDGRLIAPDVGLFVQKQGIPYMRETMSPSKGKTRHVYVPQKRRGAPYRMMERPELGRYSVVEDMSRDSSRQRAQERPSAQIRVVSKPLQHRVAISDGTITLEVMNKRRSRHVVATEHEAKASGRFLAHIEIPSAGNPSAIKKAAQKAAEAIAGTEAGGPFMLNIAGTHAQDGAWDTDYDAVASMFLSELARSVDRGGLLKVVTGHEPGMDAAIARAASRMVPAVDVEVVVPKGRSHTKKSGRAFVAESDAQMRKRLGLEQRETTMPARDLAQVDAILESLSRRTGIEFRYEDSEDGPSGRFANGVVYINRLKVGLDTPFHEFIHPFILGVEEANPALYRNLSRQVNKKGTGKDGKSIYEEISGKKAYRDLSAKDRTHEAIVEALGRYAAGIYNDAHSDTKGLVAAIKRLLATIRKYVADLLGMDRIKPSDLRADTSLRELAMIFAIGEGQIAVGIDVHSSESDEKSQTYRKAEMADRVLGVMKRRLAYIKSKGNKAEIKELATQIASLEKDISKKDFGKGLAGYLAFAEEMSRQIDTKLRDAIEGMLSMDNTIPSWKKLNLGYLSKLGEQIAQLEMVTDIAESLTDEDIAEAGVAEDKPSLRTEIVSPIVERIAFMKAQYATYAPKMAAKWLFSYNNDPSLTIHDYERLLRESDQDISWMMRNLNSLASVPDPVLATVDNVIRKHKNEVQQDEFYFRQRKLMPAVKKLEEYNRKAGVSNDNMEEKFGFMLAKDGGGKPTGSVKTIDQIRKDASPEQLAFAELYLEEMAEANKRLPDFRNLKAQVPAILKSGVEDVIERGTITAAKKAKEHAINIEVDQTGYGSEVLLDAAGRPLRWAPVHYTATIGHKKGQVKPEDVSYDLASSMLRFRTMTKNYEGLEGTRNYEKGERYHPGIKSQLEVIRNLVESRTVLTGKKSKTDGTDIGKDPTRVNASKMLSDALDMKVYGEYKERETFKVGSKEYAASEIYDLIGKYSSMTQLGLNIFSAVNNSVVGNIHNFMSASGGQFFDVASWMTAKRGFWSNPQELLRDFTSRKPKGKRAVIVHQWDLLQEFDEFGNPLEREKMLHRFGTGAVYFMHKSGELEIQVTHAEAMMRSHRVDEDGRIYSYSDWLRAGKGTTKKEFKKLPSVWSKIEVKDGIAKYGHFTTQEEMNRLTDRIKGNYERLHGNYAKMDTAAINRKGLGRLVLMFRKWMKPAWDRRWAKTTFGKRVVIDERTGLPKLDAKGKQILEDYDAFDQRLSDNVGGIYMTTIDVLRRYFSELKAWNLDAISQDWDSLPMWKKAAVRETTIEMLITASAFLIANAIARAELGDDDDFKSWMANFGEYQARRLQAELSMFYRLDEAVKLLRSPMASVQLAEDVITFGGRVVTIEGWQEYETGPYKGQIKAIRSGKKLLPGLSQYDRVTINGVKSALQWIR